MPSSAEKYKNAAIIYFVGSLVIIALEDTAIYSLLVQFFVDSSRQMALIGSGIVAIIGIVLFAEAYLIYTRHKKVTQLFLIFTGIEFLVYLSRFVLSLPSPMPANLQVFGLGVNGLILYYLGKAVSWI